MTDSIYPPRWFVLGTLGVALLVGSLVYRSRSVEKTQHVTLHHLYLLDGKREELITNPRLVYGEGFTCPGDDELVRMDFLRDEETGLVMLACFWRSR